MTFETITDATPDSSIDATAQATLRRVAHWTVCLAAALVAVLAFLGIDAGTAQASTPPVTYALSYNACTTITDGASSTGYVDFSRPVAASNYTGTSYLYWAAQLQAFVNGSWRVLGSSYDATYAHIWGHSGTQLTPIYWANTANNYGAEITVVPGYSYRVVGQTYWWNGSAWFVTNRTLEVICNF